MKIRGKFLGRRKDGLPEKKAGLRILRCIVFDVVPEAGLEPARF
jgi:hypothetical protein